MLILLLLSAFFSGSETALFSLPRVVIGRLRRTTGSGKHVAHLLDDPNRLLITILLGNLTFNILFSELVGVQALHIFEPFPYSTYLGSIAAVIVSTGLILLFGEIAPKTFAILNAERFALTVAMPLRLFSQIVLPILRVVLLLNNAILRAFGIDQEESPSISSEEELKTMVELGEEEGVLESSERMMIHKVFEFGDTLVRDVYVPRPEMVRVKSDITVEELTNIMRETGHSRFPVYGDTVDDIKGIVYAKDLFPYFWRGQTNIPISRFLRPAYYVPGTKKVSDLLREFQTGRLHMAIVVGEYGGTRGLVTLEDLVEEVVGEIFDEYDERKMIVERLPDGDYLVDARVRLDELSENLGKTVHLRDCDTVGGLLYELLEHMPSPNESVEYSDFIFSAEELDRHRIRKVRVSPRPADQMAGEGEAEK